MRRNGSDLIKYHKKSDFILIALFLLLALLLYLWTGFRSDGQYLDIIVDGKVQETYSLDEEYQGSVTLPGGENRFEIHDGEVSMVFADCPDQICVHHKKISSDGETIVCLPHKLILQIRKENDAEETEFDGLT